MTTLSPALPAGGGLAALGAASTAPGAAAGAVGGSDRAAKVAEQAQMLEGVFLNLMLQAMRKTVQSSGGVLPESNGQRVMREMLDGRLADEMAKRELLGVADHIARQLVRESDGDGGGAGSRTAVFAAEA